MMKDGEDIQKGERGGLKRKLTGPPKLLLGRTRTRSSGEDPAQKQLEHKTSASRSDAAAERKDELTCRGRHDTAGDCDDVRNRTSRRWWSRFSTALVCISKNKETGTRLVTPSEEVLQKRVSTNTEEEERQKFKVKKMFRKFLTSPDVDQVHSQSRVEMSSLGFQKKLQKFFIRQGMRQMRQSTPTENMKDNRVEDKKHVSELTEVSSNETDGLPEAMMVMAEMNFHLVEDQVERPESPKETPEKDFIIPGNRSETIQTTNMKVPVQVVSSDEDQDLCDSTVTVDLHDQFPSVEKTSQTFQTAPPSTNGPSIWIEVCPPEDRPQEEEEEGYWEGNTSSENHLHLLLGFNHSEQQLLQVARSLVQAAMTAAVDQLTREQL